MSVVNARPRAAASIAAGRAGGFTLIELMITVSVIAILAAIAYPSYTDHVAKGRRAETRAMMLEGAQWMERFYAENYCYSKNTKDVAVTTFFADRFSQSPKTGTATYTLALEDIGAAGDCATTYTLVATRTGPMASDKCGDFTLNHLGSRSVKNFGAAYADETAARTDCWK